MINEWFNGRAINQGHNLPLLDKMASISGGCWAISFALLSLKWTMQTVNCIHKLRLKVAVEKSCYVCWVWMRIQKHPAPSLSLSKAFTYLIEWIWCLWCIFNQSGAVCGYSFRMKRFENESNSISSSVWGYFIKRSDRRRKRKKT